MNRTDVTGSPSLIWPFLAWAVVGAGACFTVLAALSIGVYVAPAVIIALIVLLRWERARTIAAFGMISGLGPVLLYVAYLNRGGPGNVCTTSGISQSCVTEMSPWPWLVAGIAALAAGIAAFAAQRPHRNRFQ